VPRPPNKGGAADVAEAAAELLYFVYMRANYKLGLALYLQRGRGLSAGPLRRNFAVMIQLRNSQITCRGRSPSAEASEQGGSR